MTLEGLVGIYPSGAITFVSQLYAGTISDWEIMLRSRILSQEYEDGNSVVADIGFQIQDIFSLGLEHPLLGGQQSNASRGCVQNPANGKHEDSCGKSNQQN